MTQLQSIYTNILKQGISDVAITDKSKNNFGKIAVANSKEQMIFNKGYTVGSVEKLMSNSKVVTHFTPNVYQYLSRKNGTVSGHEEHNLKQINTFVIDFDSDAIAYTDILIAGLDLEVLPTLILSTDKGYHAYFVLEQPVFVTRKTQYKSLKVAKKISQNLRIAFSDKVAGVDTACNHFGYFRCPNTNNVVYYDDNQLHNFKDLMDWSQRQSDDAMSHLHLIVDNTLNTSRRQIDEKWYQTLIQQSQIHAGYDLGRNNSIFTLSLANYQSNVSIDACLDKMDQFNSTLEVPLNARTVETIVKSAYSGKYQGANQTYIKILMDSWCDHTYTTSAYRVFYKHKKTKAERKNLYAYEREAEIIEYINQNAKKGVVQISLRALAKHFSISVSTLKEALDKSTKIIQKTVGKGRSSRTFFYTMRSLVQHANKEAAFTFLNTAEIENIYRLTPKKYKHIMDQIIKEGRAKQRNNNVYQDKLLL